MSDIVQEARELLEGWKVDFWGLKEFYLTGTHREIVEGLLERIEELEQERDAALETLRLERLSQSVNKSDVIRAETQRDYADARVLRMVEKMDEARRGEAVALEQVRKLEEAPNA